MAAEKTNRRCEVEAEVEGDKEEYLDGGIPTAVEDLPGLDGLDCSHLQ